MNDMTKVVKQSEEKYEGFPTYLECQSRALMYGLSSFTLSFAVTYFLQELNRKRMPFGRKYFLIAPVIVASVVSWNVSRRKTRDCQLLWMAAEGKLTALPVTDYNGRVPEINRPSETSHKKTVSPG